MTISDVSFEFRVSSFEFRVQRSNLYVNRATETQRPQRANQNQSNRRTKDRLGDSLPPRADSKSKGTSTVNGLNIRLPNSKLETRNSKLETRDCLYTTSANCCSM